jgi:hypothetical protein
MRMPRALLTKVMFFEKNESKWLDKNYEYLQNELHDHFVKYNTTLKLAEHFLNEVKLIVKKD